MTPEARTHATARNRAQPHARFARACFARGAGGDDLLLSLLPRRLIWQVTMAFCYSCSSGEARACYGVTGDQ
eukprot:6801207-Prymnesium_polylepis.1